MENGKTPLSKVLDEAEEAVSLVTSSKASAAGALLRRSIERLLVLGIEPLTVHDTCVQVIQDFYTPKEGSSHD